MGQAAATRVLTGAGVPTPAQHGNPNPSQTRRKVLKFFFSKPTDQPTSSNFWASGGGAMALATWAK